MNVPRGPRSESITAIALQHRAAAVGPAAEAARQQAGRHQVFERVAGEPFALCRELGKLHQLHVGNRLNAAGQLDLILRAHQAPEESRREVHENRVVALERHQRAGLVELARFAERSLARPRREEPLHDCLRRGEEVKVAIDGVK